MTTIDKLPQPIRESVEFYVERRRKMLEKGKGETALQLQGRIEGLLEAMHHLNIIDYSDYCDAICDIVDPVFAPFRLDENGENCNYRCNYCYKFY